MGNWMVTQDKDKTNLTFLYCEKGQHLSKKNILKGCKKE
jgi:hypothetical protein